jgi:hypothetical protein
MVTSSATAAWRCSRGWSGHFDPVPVAEHGFAGLEAMSGQLPPLDEWPLFHEALEQRRAVFAADAQAHRDVPPALAGPRDNERCGGCCQRSRLHAVE